MGPPRPGRKLVYSGDTRPCEALRIAAHRADVLVHEATFAEEERERAAQTGHSTAAQAATVARDAEVTLLALNHFSTRYPPGLLRDEAREIFPRTVLPRDFDTIEIPFPERGEPELVRWDRSTHAAEQLEPARWGRRARSERSLARHRPQARATSRGVSGRSREIARRPRATSPALLAS